MKVRFAFIAVVVLFSFGCNKNEVEYITIRYNQPLYGVSVAARVPVTSTIKEDSKINHYLGLHQIVKILSSHSYKGQEPIRYFIEAGDIKGFVLDKDIEPFYNEKEAEDFLLTKIPGREVLSSLHTYEQAESAYLDSDYELAIQKLGSFLSSDPSLKERHPVLYFSTEILIGKLYLKAGQGKRAIKHFERLSSQTINDDEVKIVGTQFDPHNIRFYSRELELYIKQQPYKSRICRLSWESSFYIAMAYELNKKSAQAKKQYAELFKTEPKLSANLSKQKILYINFAIDRICSISSLEQSLSQLEELKLILDTKGVGRYIFFKLGILLEKRSMTYDAADDGHDADIRVAVDYYSSFVKVFEALYIKDPYPGEVSQYLLAKERVIRLTDPSAAIKSEPLSPVPQSTEIEADE